MEGQTTSKSGVFQELQGIGKRWGWVLALGVVMALAGVVALGATVTATLATVWFLGAVLLGAGVIDIVSAFASKGWRGFGLPLVSGILAALVGGLLMFRPAVGAGVLTLVLALMLLASGIARIFYSAAERFPSWGWSFVSGIVAVALGVLVFAEFPTSAFWFLGLVVAVELLFRGTLWIALAFALHRAAPEAPEAARVEERPAPPQAGPAEA